MTKKSFKSSDLPVIIDYLQTHVMSLLGPNKKLQTTAEAVKEEFECIETKSKLFTALQDKYISWFNYKLMIKLVGVCLPENFSLKRCWSDYEEKLKDYFINSGGLLKNADAVQFGVKGVPPGTRVMIAKVDRDDYTLDDIFFFGRAIPKGLDIPKYDLHFRFIHLNSLCLEYLIPEYLYSLLFPLTTKLQQQLASIGITELTCGENKYDLREFSIEEVKYSSTDIGASLSLLACQSGELALVHKLESLNLFLKYSSDFYGLNILHYSSMSNNVDLFKYLVNRFQLFIGVKDRDNRTPLHIASWYGSSIVVEYIYNLNANDTDYNGRTPLVYSCLSGSIRSVKYLLNNHNSDPNITDDDGMTCLHHSCRNVDKSGLTALQYASVSLNLTLVKKLKTTSKLDPHQADSNGKLPIHYAAQSGDILLLELYVKDYKCSLSLTDSNGWNIFHFSSFEGHTHFIKQITSQYPQYISLLHSTDNDYHIPLHLACNSGNIQLVAFLINDINCDVNAKNTRDNTCVTFACFSGNLDLVQILIQQYKLDPLAVDKYGFTALHASAQTGHTHILEWYSQEYSVDITNHTDNNKYTLAHSAAYNGKLHCLQQLINKYQCDVNATTTDTGTTVLHKACEGGHVPVVFYLTSLPLCNVAAKTSNGSTVLHITCEYSDSLPILKHLVENHQLDLCAVNDEGMAPIHLACSEGRLNLIKYIIEHIPSSLELPHGKHGRTPFLIAVYFSQLEVIKYLISKKCNVSATDDEGSGAVHISVEGHLNVLKYLIDNNYCNPNATNYQDRTPLHAAVAANEFEILEYLLSKSKPSMSVAWLRGMKCLLDSPHHIYNNPHNAVLINVQDKDGNTPLHLACQKKKQKMVSLLLKASLSNNNLLITNKKGQTPLHLAVASGHKDTAEALLFSVTGSSTHHDLLTATDNEGSTVFYTACSHGYIDVFCYLSNIYPQCVNVMDNTGRGLLHAACERGDIGVVRTLIETHGLDPLAEDEDGITCLHLLAERKRVYMYQYLEPNIVSNPVPKDKSGRTPLHYASRSDNIDMVHYLIETFPCTPDDPDNNGYTSVHGACEAGSMELVQYFLTDLKCNALAETDDCKSLFYFASKSSNLELVWFLINAFGLKPRPLVMLK
ncbi:PREDICTED: serine/threonine-protein phosphatase 6 regulatory ankyrin repeat subunit A-like [Amphimedon queenslandica]|uniref:Uncharacterized protein n=1 Tax=Amphimedon queenslandica TaxID=400682 RepID=A0AAN0JKK3_AMPQE|nr:PREDICTED: serine/threonine-protein phosphatase 6 regulatory ankyrin repeat subunit A-like [Amphimedon queenslandica]|eukprot:XP_019857542.1 PREDICTED: serine/threonine-protein phosphatase 6 regulatory ankyrin repeat subunit A-like [Amphimedon queenslandica]